MKRLILTLLFLIVSSQAWATNYCLSSQSCYLLTEGSGTSASDSSGNSNTGTLKADGNPAWISTVPSFNTSGTAAYSLSFAGQSSNGDYVKVNHAASIDNLAAITFTAWVYPKGLGGGSLGRIIDKSGAGAGISLYLVSGSTYFKIRFSDGYSTTSISRETNISAGNGLVANAWNFLVVTWDGSSTASNIHIYLNNVESNSYNATTNASGTRLDDSALDLYVGNASNFQRTFNGYIAQPAIFNSVLSSTDLTAIYNYGLSPSSPSAAHSIFSQGTLNNGSINN